MKFQTGGRGRFAEQGTVDLIVSIYSQCAVGEGALNFFFFFFLVGMCDNVPLCHTWGLKNRVYRELNP